MRLALFATLAALPLALPAAAQTMACERIGGESAPGVVDAVGYEVRLEAGRVANIVLRLPNARTTSTNLVPVRDEAGRSMRMITFPIQSNAVTAVFNLVTVEQTGTVLMETWIRESNAPAEAPPRHNWYRLRCQGSGGGK